MAEVPGQSWRMLATPFDAQQLPKGLDAAMNSVVATVMKYKPHARRFLQRADRVLNAEQDFAQQSDAHLRQTSRELRCLFRKGRETPHDLDRAFALVREVAHRQLGERPFAVQIAGAMAIEAGCIAEMATGEGKTLTATMPAVIAGWRGRGCHIITVNDYLAQRDAEWMGSIYRFCGLSVAYVQQGMPSPDRRRAYQADITYCTNKEVTADFLRDRLALGRMKRLPSVLLGKIANGVDVASRLVQRGLHFAIVDEADSVLIDEAVTPLIISGDAPNVEQVNAFTQAAELAAQLESSADYFTDHRFRDINLTKAGQARVARFAQEVGGVWRGFRRAEELLVQALHAREYYIRDKQYVVQDGKIVIVDEFTGRLMPDRTWRDGLHQAIEAKESLKVNEPKDTFARISFQRFFRLYRKLSGMTGTASEACRELWNVYRLRVAVIPPNQPCIRENLPDRIFASASAKWNALVAEIVRIHGLGRPILVGTRNVRDSEHLSQLLRSRELDHKVLNAIRHADEAQIVAGAGQVGQITVATNMAGRGTDIKLGRGVASLGGLHVVAAERHEAGRVDRQLYGRAGRQGDPGSAQAFVSLEDELVLRYTPHLSAMLRRRYRETTDGIAGPASRRLFDRAQRRAEAQAHRQRKGVLLSDDWLDEHLGFAGGKF